MNELTVSTVVYESPETIYEFLEDFPRYARYSDHLTDVRRLGGDVDAEPRAKPKYALRFAWWKLSYTVHSTVTDVVPPERIDWRITKDLDARGSWQIDPLDELPDGAPPEATDGCRVTFEVRYDPHSADSELLDLPRFVSIGWVVRKAVPIVRREAERVFERAVADIEGRRRRVDLDVRTDSTR